LGGIGLIINPRILLKKRKIYDLRLRVFLDSDIFELSVKIAVMKIARDNQVNHYDAVYRELSDSQLTGLKMISEQFSRELARSGGLNAIIFR
jgi:hypothetical protein